MAEFKKNIFRRFYSIFKTRRKLFLIIFSSLLHLLILNNVVLLSSDMIYGDFSATNLKPLPGYGFMRVPESPLAEEVEGVNRLAADFAQIYFPARNSHSLTQAYTKETLDPWHRPSRYAPFLHSICSISICKLNYGYASLSHMIIQLLLFYISFVYAFKALHIEKYMVHGLLLVNFCLFLTPVGLSMLERGQFTLYTSLSYLWIVLGIINRNILFVILSALFAYVKFTSFPFILVVLVLWVLNSQNYKELKRSIFPSLVFGTIVVVFFLVYLESSISFIMGAIRQEAFYNPGGLSLTTLLPKPFVKALPLILILLGYLHIKKFKNDFILLIPYLAGCGIILITYPTLPPDYSVPCLFGFIPLVIYWSKHPAIHNHHYTKTIIYLFLAFIIIASLSHSINRLFDFNKFVLFYMLFSIILIFLPLFYPSKYQELKN
tara:strand:+ start:25028 stop:26329 length:1302 start_codon:yes stop_codon:yes gene_type:complete